MIAVGRGPQLQGLAVERLLDPSPAAIKRMENCFESALYACRWDEARRWLHWLSEVDRQLPKALRDRAGAELSALAPPPKPSCPRRAPAGSPGP